MSTHETVGTDPYKGDLGAHLKNQKQRRLGVCANFRPASRRPGRDTRLLDRLRCPRRHMKQRARQQGDPGAFRVATQQQPRACRSSAYCDARLHTDRAVKNAPRPQTGRSASSSTPHHPTVQRTGGAAWALRRAASAQSARPKAQERSKTNQAVSAQERRGRLRRCAPACHHVRRYRWQEAEEKRKETPPKGAGRGGQGHRVSRAATLMPGGIKVRVGDRPLSSHRLGPHLKGERAERCRRWATWCVRASWRCLASEGKVQETDGGSRIFSGNPMDQDLETRLKNLRQAPGAGQ